MKPYDAKTADNKCPFCEIVNGNIKTPGIISENDEFMSFLAINPNTEGFTCVIPKKHFNSDILKMPDDVLQRLIVYAKNISGILENYYQDVGRVGLMMEGMGIDHAHIKLMPLHGTDHLKRGEWKQILSGKEFWFDKYEGWICSGGGPKADPKKLKTLSEKIKDSIK